MQETIHWTFKACPVEAMHPTYAAVVCCVKHSFSKHDGGSVRLYAFHGTIRADEVNPIFSH